MKRVHGFVAVVALALLLGSGLQGQDKDTKVKGTLPANWGKLSLSEEQKQKVYKIQGDYHDKIASLEKQVKDLKATEKTEMEKVLSDAQKALLKEIILKKAGVDDKKDK
jgi:hypothetical protein